MKVSPAAGKPVAPDMLVDVPRLLAAYFANRPDGAIEAQRVAFGTSGHRGSAFDSTFNEWHVLAISQAVCDYRKRQGTGGPLFVGIDTHALSVPACASALEVLAANGVDVMLAERDEFTPTPAVSHAILVYNRGRSAGLADGVVITPSHNPPDDGGFKYNPPHGGPADTDATGWIQNRANELLRAGLTGVKRLPFASALKAASTHQEDFVLPYVNDLRQVVDMEAIRAAERIHPHANAGPPNRRHVEHVGEVIHVRIEKIMPVRGTRTHRLRIRHSLHASQTGSQIFIGLRLYPARGRDVGWPAVDAVVFVAAVVGRIVRRRDDNAVGMAGASSAVVNEYGVGNRRSRRKFVALCQHDIHTVGGQHFERARACRHG